MTDLDDFLRESNRIEGIAGYRPREMTSLKSLLAATELTVEGVTAFVTATQGDAFLRDHVGLDVRVGSFYPPPGGPEVRRVLIAILSDINQRVVSPYQGHRRYENLHPYTDGNGRSGRAVWLWQMLRDGGTLYRSFLHQWYYQSLAAPG